MIKVFYNIFFLLFQECVIDIENGIFPDTKTLVPGTTLTGSCNSGYIALSGQIEVTCHEGYTTTYSDTCRLGEFIDLFFWLFNYVLSVTFQLYKGCI